MSKTVSSQLYRRITRLRWQAPTLAFFLVLLHQIIEHTWLIHLPRWWHFATQVLFYGFVGPVLAWWALSSLRRSVAETETAERALKLAHTKLKDANARLALLIRVNRRLAEAEDEDALLAVMLELPLEVVPAAGCSLIRFDERRQPLPALHRGTLAPQILEAWSTHLADAQMRRQCACCTVHVTTTADSCPVFSTFPDATAVHKVYCLALARGNREYGVLNIFLEEHGHPTEQEESLLLAMAQEMSLALESQHLQAREMAMLSHLQQAHRLSNLNNDLTEMLAHTVEALEGDGGVLFLTAVETGELHIQAQAGRPLGPALEWVQGLASSAGQGESPFIIRDLDQQENSSIRSLLAMPLRTNGRTLGSLLLWANRPDAFTRRRTRLVGIVAGQTALLVENYRLSLQGEYRAALAERTRLAREIHDGLAQTLGYLKLRAAQISGWLQSGEEQRTANGIEEIQQLLNEVYVDAREAIDGLHLQTGKQNLEAWIREVITDFEALSDVEVIWDSPPEIAFPLEVHTQLQRIVQEALSNVRKHAEATQVYLRWHADDRCLRLEIADNGRGFDSSDIPLFTQHGLRTMRERAELLEADFQISSRPHGGTKIVIMLPLRKVAAEVEDV